MISFLFFNLSVFIFYFSVFVFYFFVFVLNVLIFTSPFCLSVEISVFFFYAVARRLRTSVFIVGSSCCFATSGVVHI